MLLKQTRNAMRWVTSMWRVALDAVPTTTLPAGTGRAANLAAMHHPSWVPIRVLAEAALGALSGATAGNARCLGLA